MPAGPSQAIHVSMVLGSEQMDKRGWKNRHRSWKVWSIEGLGTVVTQGAWFKPRGIKGSETILVPPAVYRRPSCSVFAV